MPVEIVDTIKENEGRKADKVDCKSEEENGADDLKCLDWLVSYKLPEHFAILDDSFHQFTEKNLFHNSNNGSISDDTIYHKDNDQVAEQVICNERMICSTLTGTKISKNPDWEKLSPNWKFSVGKILLTSKCFMYKHSSWSINTDFALKYERAALAQGFSHRCPPFISSTCEIIDIPKKVLQ